MSPTATRMTKRESGRLLGQRAIVAQGEHSRDRLKFASAHFDFTLRASTIVGFHQDDEDWVAELSCGHHQHVRYRPPAVERPWVLTELGRAEKLGHTIMCAQCVASGYTKVQNAPPNLDAAMALFAADAFILNVTAGRPRTGRS